MEGTRLSIAAVTVQFGSIVGVCAAVIATVGTRVAVGLMVGRGIGLAVAVTSGGYVATSGIAPGPPLDTDGLAPEAAVVP